MKQEEVRKILLNLLSRDEPCAIRERRRIIDQALSAILALEPKMMSEQEVFDFLVHNYPEVPRDKWPNVETFKELAKALVGKVR